MVKISYRGWWITMTNVMPIPLILLSICTSSIDVVESSPLVGSSKNAMDGLLTSSTAMLTLLR